MKISLVGILCLLAVIINSCSNSTSNGPAKIYNTAGTITTGSSVGFTGRAGAPACAIGGKIYVIGGETNNGLELGTLEVYDPATDTWSTPQTNGSMSPRKYLMGAEVAGKIYAIGGYHNGVGSTLVEIFDPATNTWSMPSTKGVFTGRWAASACVLNNKIYVIGGFADGHALKTIEIFDPATNTWSTPPQVNTMSTTRQFHGCGVVGGKIYLVGGNDGSSSSTAVTVVDVFDPVANSWSMLPTTGTFTPRYGLTASVINGYIYAAGGYDGFNYQNTLEVLDPQKNTWSTPEINTPLVARTSPSSAVIGNSMYLTGGWNGFEEMTATEIFTQSP